MEERINVFRNTIYVAKIESFYSKKQTHPSFFSVLTSEIEKLPKRKPSIRNRNGWRTFNVFGVMADLNNKNQEIKITCSLRQ